MYCPIYAKFLITSQLSKEAAMDALKIIDVVPTCGIINNCEEIITYLNFSNKRFIELIELMAHTKQAILVKNKFQVTFCYPQSDIDRFRHYRNAKSNFGMIDL